MCICEPRPPAYLRISAPEGSGAGSAHRSERPWRRRRTARPRFPIPIRKAGRMGEALLHLFERCNLAESPT